MERRARHGRPGAAAAGARCAWRARSVALLTLLSLLVGGCVRAEPTGRPLVAVSVEPQAWFVERLAGDLVDVAVMIPPGSNPHVHEPSVAQMKALARASLYVKVGHPDFTFEAVYLQSRPGGEAGLVVVDGSAGLPVQADDPHVWTSPDGGRALARNTAAGLAVLLPGQAGLIESRLAALLSEIDALDARLAALLEPVRGGRFFVFHPAWGYLAQRYGLVQVAIEHEHKDPSARHLGEVIAQARAQRCRAVLVAPYTSSAGAEVVAREVGAELAVADPLARAWDENLLAVAATLAELLEGA